MKEITLHVNDENVETLLNILNNLKEGLIVDMTSTHSVKAPTKYTPPTNKVILEGDSAKGKYINASAYKQRLNAKKNR